MCPRGHDAKTSASEHLTSPFLLRCSQQGRVLSSLEFKMMLACGPCGRKRSSSRCGPNGASAMAQFAPIRARNPSMELR